jgi:release factor glutamine methyltransferase
MSKQEHKLTVGHALKEATQRFRIAGIPTPEVDARWLMAHLLACSVTEVFFHQHEPLTAEMLKAWEEMVKQRCLRRPLAYIIGSWDFMGLKIKVDERVMIPRQETEELVEHFITKLRSRRSEQLTIADVGTGSGAIAIALAVHFANAHIFAIDISDEALQLAEENAKAHGVDERITFVCGSLLEALKGIVEHGSLSAVIANLPYVAEHEVAMLPPEVLKYEPKSSWYGGFDGLCYIRELLNQAHDWLCVGGLLALEVGHNHADCVLNLLEASGKYEQIEVLKDSAGVRRFVFAKRR